MRTAKNGTKVRESADGEWSKITFELPADIHAAFSEKCKTLGLGPKHLFGLGLYVALHLDSVNRDAGMTFMRNRTPISVTIGPADESPKKR